MNKINDQRFLSNLLELSKIGATKDGGVSRVAFSDEDLLGRDWFKKKIEDYGFEYNLDGAGNQSAILRGKSNKKKILFGSHLDSVPNGGKYDGALGTLATLEALCRLKEMDYQPERTLEVVNFTSEENVVLLMMGSRAMAGLLKPEDLNRASLEPEEFNRRLVKLGISRESILNAKRDDVAAWFELHIEQATNLENTKTDIGLVTSIVGIRNFRITFNGEAAHAGTKPMRERKDALWGASNFILNAKDLIINKFSPGTVNVGKMQVNPGALNIVPEEVIIDVEFRHGKLEVLDQMQEELLGLLKKIEKDFGLVTQSKPIPSVEPTPMSEMLIQALENSCKTCSLTYERMLSFAGHDTQSMAKICPSAMFFVPSVKGVSHNPAEYTKDQDCVNGANVILNTIINLCERLDKE
jgi:N-carbamoyl-L-amino-acid hydrolase